MHSTVVLISPDVGARAAALRALRASAAEVTAYDTSTEWLTVLQRPGPDCAVIDCALADLVPAQLQAELQQRGLHVPLLFLVGRNEVDLAVSLMKAGAVDVLVRPLETNELQRRTQAVLAERAGAEGPRGSSRDRLGRLTQREGEVVALATNGLSNKAIGEKLGISFRTIEVHRRNALRKTGAANVVELTHLVNTAWGPEPSSHRFHPSPLSDRERQICALIAAGNSAKEIGAQLKISTRTVESHLGNAQRKHLGETPDTGFEQLQLWPTGEPVRGDR